MEMDSNFGVRIVLIIYRLKKENSTFRNVAIHCLIRLRSGVRVLQ